MQTQRKRRDRRKLVRTSVPQASSSAAAATWSFGATAGSSTRNSSVASPRRARRRARCRRATGGPPSQVRFEDFYEQWIDSLRRADRAGLHRDVAAPSTGRLIERHALPRWRAWKLGRDRAAQTCATCSSICARDGVGGSDAPQAADGALVDVRDAPSTTVWCAPTRSAGCASRRRRRAPRVDAQGQGR